jgi:hypothetical protein
MNQPIPQEITDEAALFACECENAVRAAVLIEF